MTAAYSGHSIFGCGKEICQISPLSVHDHQTFTHSDSVNRRAAGDAGRGFSVVAEEIRKLSDQCLESAGQISEIVNEIVKQTSEVVSTAKEAEEAVSSQTGAVSGTTNSFMQIRKQIARLSDALEVITNNVYNMDTSRNKTLGTMEDISAVSAETRPALRKSNPSFLCGYPRFPCQFPEKKPDIS